MPKDRNRRGQTRLKINVARVEYIKCDTRKKGYATKGEALDAAELMMELGQVNAGCHMTPYLCPFCQEFHVSNRVIVPVPGSVPVSSSRYAGRRKP
jgi:hypothetical protein